MGRPGEEVGLAPTAIGSALRGRSLRSFYAQQAHLFVASLAGDSLPKCGLRWGGGGLTAANAQSSRAARGDGHQPVGLVPFDGGHGLNRLAVPFHAVVREEASHEEAARVGWPRRHHEFGPGRVLVFSPSRPAA